jgi:hypothetical protein
MNHKAPNQGEGDRESARRYDEHLRDFEGEGEGRWVSVDQIVEKGRSVFERIRSRLARK